MQGAFQSTATSLARKGRKGCFSLWAYRNVEKLPATEMQRGDTATRSPDVGLFGNLNTLRSIAPEAFEGREWRNRL